MATATSTAGSPLSAAPVKPAGRGFIAGPWYDGLLFIGSPLLSIALVKWLVAWDWHRHEVAILGEPSSTAHFFISTWTYAHLIAVAFRSHVNPDVFPRHKIRFVVVPAALFVAFMISDWLFITGLILAAFWDVYHTSMQNFGFGRIYDAKRGNPPLHGRRIDIAMNHFVYIGPIFIGLNLKPHVEPLFEYERFGWLAPGKLAQLIETVQDELTAVVVSAFLFFACFYVYYWVRAYRNGYRISWQKVALLVSTAVASIWAWGFLPPFEAFFAANFFHALQYFGIVWWSERKHVSRRFGLDRLSFGRWLAGALFVGSIFAVGIVYTIGGNHAGLRWVLAAGVVISLMHFWYDGFIWSIRKRDVAIAT